jgi:hypothetical protein
MFGFFFCVILYKNIKSVLLLVITVMGIRQAENFNWLKSILVTLLAAIPYVSLILTFIR